MSKQEIIDASKSNAGERATFDWKIFLKNPICYIVIAIIALSAVIAYFKMQKIEDKGYQLGYASGIIYRMSKGFEITCDANGYKMKKFPQQFKQRYDKEIKKIDLTLKDYGTNLQRLFEDMDNSNRLRQSVMESVTEELMETKKQIILEFLQEKNGNKPLEWDDKFDEYLPLWLVCHDMDDNAENYFKAYDITKMREVRDIIKNF